LSINLRRIVSCVEHGHQVTFFRGPLAGGGKGDRRVNDGAVSAVAIFSVPRFLTRGYSLAPRGAEIGLH